MNTQPTSNSPPPGLWLRLARLALIAFAIFLLGLLVVGVILFPNYAERHYWEFTPNAFWTGEQTQAALAELNWPPTMLAWYLLITDIVATLIGLSFALFLLWRKSDDWFGLYLTFAFLIVSPGSTLFEPVLESVPALVSPVDLLGAIGWQLVFILFYVFPDGRFVPRWTRLMALYEVAGAVMATFLGNAILAVLGRAFIGFVFLLPSFGTGVFAQLYRYFQMARPAERQQLKWVIVGLAGFVSTAVAVLLPLDALLTTQAASMDPARAIVLSTIPDTLWQVNNLFIAVSITFSVVRYRLWDVDIVINRTLVYGALTASVVGLYVLIVGGLSIVLQTQNNLPGIVIAILAIAFLFQPLYQRLQGIANRFVPVPQSTSPSEQPEDKITISEGAADTTLRGHWLFVARLTWIALIIVTVGLFIAAIPGYASEIREYVQASRTIVAPAWDIVLYMSGSVISVASALLSFILAVMLIWRKPNEKMALLVSCYLLLFGAVLGGSLERTVMVWPAWEVQASAIAKPFLFATPTVMLFALFPSGRFVPSWTRGLTLASILLIVAILYLPPYWWPDVRKPIASITAITWAVILLAALYAQIYRYRRISNSTERQQTKWVVFGFFLWLLLVTVVSGPYAITYGSSPLSPHPWWAPVVRVIWFLSSTILPISLTIAVMRYQLFDIDLLINRSVVYLTLTAIVVGIYVLIVGYLGVLFRKGNNLAISLTATGLVAVIFQPLRDRLQRAINRLMYGERDDPYAVLSRLGQRLDATLAPEAVLPTIVETVAQTLKLPYVAIALKHPGANKIKIAAAFGAPVANPLCLPLVYQTETVGQLLLGSRAPAEPFSPTDRRLLDDLAHQVVVAAQAVRLAADLQRSREWLAREMHDSLGHRLTVAVVQLEGAQRLIPTDPERAARMIGAMRDQMKEALAELRQTVAALRNPLEGVEDAPLDAALTHLAQTFQDSTGLAVHLDLPDSLPALPATHRLALYRAAQESLTNAQRHASAKQVWLTVSAANGHVTLTAADDGKGFGEQVDTSEGSYGLRGLRERAAQLGGELILEDRRGGGAQLRFSLPLLEAPHA